MVDFNDRRGSSISFIQLFCLIFLLHFLRFSFLNKIKAPNPLFYPNLFNDAGNRELTSAVTIFENPKIANCLFASHGILPELNFSVFRKTNSILIQKCVIYFWFSEINQLLIDLSCKFKQTVSVFLGIAAKVGHIWAHIEFLQSITIRIIMGRGFLISFFDFLFLMLSIEQSDFKSSLN